MFEWTLEWTIDWTLNLWLHNYREFGISNIEFKIVLVFISCATPFDENLVFMPQNSADFDLS